MGPGLGFEVKFYGLGTYYSLVIDVKDPGVGFGLESCTDNF